MWTSEGAHQLPTMGVNQYAVACGDKSCTFTPVQCARKKPAALPRDRLSTFLRRVLVRQLREERPLPQVGVFRFDSENFVDVADHVLAACGPEELTASVPEHA